MARQGAGSGGDAGGSGATKRSATAAQRTDAALAPDDPVTALKGLGPAAGGKLAAAGIRTVAQLAAWLPRRWRALKEVDRLEDGDCGLVVRIQGRVTAVRRSWLPGRRSVTDVRFAVATGQQFATRWFNQPWLAKSWPVGTERVLEGVLDRQEDGFRLHAPRAMPKEKAAAGEVQLVYPGIDGISEARLRTWIDQILEQVPPAAWRPAALGMEALPPKLRLVEPLPSGRDLLALLRSMHRPADVAEHEAARQRFALHEAVALFRRMERLRRARLQRSGPPVPVDGAVRNRIQARIPFSWTPDQAAAVAELEAMAQGPAPMGVLLQGDVGTGKTAVALHVALATVAAGYQVAFLAPTGLLAEQHHEVLGGWLAGSPAAPVLLTADLPAAERRAAEAAVADGSARIVVGTHALFSSRTGFQRLGLVIVDEQHRFGVEQRMQLIAKGDAPHVLVMTATPIPRTLALGRFGDLDVLSIRTRPPGRRMPVARFVPASRWPRIVRLIHRRVARRGRVYVVCPAVGADGGKGGAVRLHQALAQRFRCGLVHGRMPADERRAVTAAFRAGGFDVLVGTTVLEVGVDVPDATLMVVVRAERFGLATLHQLRGRVGRGARRGLCVLTGQPSARTAALCRTTDGFALAEEDLRQRGPGEMLGRRQSGAGELRALDPVADEQILLEARAAVREEP